MIEEEFLHNKKIFLKCQTFNKMILKENVHLKQNVII